MANLTEFNHEINHETVCEAVVKSFFDAYSNSCDPEYLDHEALKTISGLTKFYEQMKNWDWRFGSTPDFSHRFDEYFGFGHLDIYLKVARGTIETAKVYSDTLFPDLIEALMSSLPGKRYTPKAMLETVSSLKDKVTEGRDYLEEIGSWIASQVR